MNKKSETALSYRLRESDFNVAHNTLKSQYFYTNSSCLGRVASISNAKAPTYLTYTDKSSPTPVENDLFFFQKSLNLFENTKKLFTQNKKLLHSLHALQFQKFKVINDNSIVLYSVSNMFGNSRAGWKLASEISDSEKARLSSKQRAHEKALANVDTWKYFATFTIDRKKQNRYDFKTFQPRFSHFLTRRGVKYFYVPERHKDGAIHVHALLSCELEPFLKEFEGKALKNPYIKKCLTEGKEVRNFESYASNFGHNIVEPIRDSEACVNYMTKYVLKTFDDEDFDRFSRRRFFCSAGLKSPYVVMPEFVDLQSFHPSKFSTHTIKVYLRRVSWPVRVPLFDSEAPPPV